MKYNQYDEDEDKLKKDTNFKIQNAFQIDLERESENKRRQMTTLKYSAEMAFAKSEAESCLIFVHQLET